MKFFFELVFWGSIALLLWPYTAYPVILKLTTPKDNRPRQAAQPPLPSVAIVIAAYNEEAVISARVENLLALNYPEELLSIFIASDGSEDQTNSFVQRFQDQRVRLVEIAKRGGKVNALNETVPLTSAEILVFSDANTCFSKDALLHLVSPFGDQSIGLVCGKLIFQSDRKNQSGEVESSYWNLETRLKEMEGQRGFLLGANGGIFAIRRELWSDCPPDTIVEDFVIAMNVLKMGYQVTFNSQALAYEETAIKPTDEYTRRVRIGAGGFQALALLLPMLAPSRGFAAFAFFSRKVLRWFAPFLMIVALVSGLLLSGTAFYAWLMALGIFGSGASMFFLLMGGNLPRLLLPGKAIAYFLLMNAALLHGFFRWLTGRQSTRWKRTPRSLASTSNSPHD